VYKTAAAVVRTTVLPGGIAPPSLEYQSSALTIGRREDWVDRADSNRLPPGSRPGPSTTSGSANKTKRRRESRRLVGALPLSYRGVVEPRTGFEPVSSGFVVRCSPCCIRLGAPNRTCTGRLPLTTRAPHCLGLRSAIVHMESPAGVEPASVGLGNRCSSFEHRGQKCGRELRRPNTPPSLGYRPGNGRGGWSRTDVVLTSIPHWSGPQESNLPPPGSKPGRPPRAVTLINGDV
jgi:hypothetical protein